MLKRPAFTVLALLLLAGGFLYGVLELFALGYRSGEVYPAYSSLRADPLGIKVLHEALGDLPGIRVRRHFRPLPRLQAPEPVTLLFAGIDRKTQWSPAELEALETRVRLGSRALFAFFPEDRRPGETERDRAARHERERAKIEKDKKRPEEEGKRKALISFSEVARRWGVRFDELPPEEKKAFARTAVATDAGRALEPKLAWHSALTFADLVPEWTTLYTSDGQPVVIERKLGTGSIVLAADPFFLSNEALRTQRTPALLGHFFSGPPTIVFDEEHLGVREEPGIANLAGKYRLQGAIATLALLAALYVWMNAVPFLPPREDPAATGLVTGKESAEGFVNLLRRTIKPADLLGVCVDEWRRTATLPPRERARLESAWAAEQARPARERQGVATYRALQAALAPLPHDLHRPAPTAPEQPRTLPHS